MTIYDIHDCRFTIELGKSRPRRVSIVNPLNQQSASGRRPLRPAILTAGSSIAASFALGRYEIAGANRAGMCLGILYIRGFVSLRLSALDSGATEFPTGLPGPGARRAGGRYPLPIYFSTLNCLAPGECRAARTENGIIGLEYVVCRLESLLV